MLLTAWNSAQWRKRFSLCYLKRKSTSPPRLPSIECEKTTYVRPVVSAFLLSRIVPEFGSGADTCMTSLFAGSWLCRLCGREACGDCYKRIKEATYLPKDATAAHKKALAQRREQLGNTCISLSCNKKREHTSNDFTPMTRFERVELETAIKNMKVIVEQDDAEMADAARQPVLTTFAPIAPPENAAYTPTISHPTPLFDIDQLDHDVFRSLWAKGNPLVVDGVLSKMNVSWTPEFFIEEFGKEECSIVDCQSDEVKSTTVKEFFATFGNFNSRNQHVWKLKVPSSILLPTITHAHWLGLAFDHRVQDHVPRPLQRLLQRCPNT
jgi:hypothetical protein